MIMTAVANISLEARGAEMQIVMVSDLSEAGCLDFNPAMYIKSFEFVTAFLLPLPPLILICSTSALTNALITAAKAFVPQEVHELFLQLRSREEIDEYVDVEDLPHWWYKRVGEVGLDCHDPDDRRNTWRRESLLNKPGGVTAADIWQPGPWLDGIGKRVRQSECAGCQKSVGLLRVPTGRGRLLPKLPSTIQENDEEEAE